MSEVGDLKWIEAGLLLAAGVAFAWWQLRDVKRAQQASRAQREAAPDRAAQPERPDQPTKGTQDKTP
jgi:predicted negative regulator of RcsB-dependent stress response